jgi:peptide/nickel transport system ATP-binding protein/oligopeptide transport system ATP-binding protein
MSTHSEEEIPEITEEIEMSFDENAIIEVQDMEVIYPVYGGIVKRRIGEVKAVRKVSFTIGPGETLGLVGESGCGKTTIGKAILGLVPVKDGAIYFRGERIDNRVKKFHRRKIQMVFQDPDASLNPRMKIFQIVGEPLKTLMGLTKRTEIRARVLQLLKEVSMKTEHLDRFPHEFSGGQKQRIVIARALACDPDVIILDEPTSALDVSVQSQILNLLGDLQKEFNLAYLFITHDLNVIHHVGDNVAVMYLGKIVEQGNIEDIFYSPAHYYTKALLSARPALNDEEKAHQIILHGEIPSPLNPPAGCSFHPRCFAQKEGICYSKPPGKIELSETHTVWCHTPNQEFDQP